ncbi:MAG: hypothetical protein HY675_06010 [Chloroflexi bacterium]|nr:hypothetical protein [Chloroflexota bacterium]
MGTQAKLVEDSPGGPLNRMLNGQRTFPENVYSLMRFLEAEISKHGWEMGKNGGYDNARNGMGRGPILKFPWWNSGPRKTSSVR